VVPFSFCRFEKKRKQTEKGGWRGASADSVPRTMQWRFFFETFAAWGAVGGFCAETAGGITLFSTAAFGIPVSTTHTITGAIVGVGSAQNISAVRWGIAGTIVWAWILTIPCTAFIAGLAWWLARAVLS